MKSSTELQNNNKRTGEMEESDTNVQTGIIIGARWG